MSVSDSFDKSDTSSNSSRSKLKSHHTVLKENQSNIESKRTSSNNVQALMKEDQVDHYERLLEEAEVTLKDKESLISILKLQIKKVEDSLKNTLEELHEINFKYSSTQQELSNLKQISDKYKEDVNTLLKNAKTGTEVVKNVSEELQVEITISNHHDLKNAKDDTEVVKNVSEGIQVELIPSNHYDLNAIKSDYGNINKAMQEQNQKIELLLKELKNEFERNQEIKNSKPGTSSESSSYTKCSLVNKLIEENKNLKDSLNRLQTENKQLLQKEKQITSTNTQPYSLRSKECVCTPENNNENEEQLDSENNEEPKTYYFRGREGSKVGFKVESNQYQSNLMKENKELHHTLNQLRIQQSENNGISQLQPEIAQLKNELKGKDDKLKALKSLNQNETTNKNEIIKEFTEKENKLKEDYNKILIDDKEIRSKLKLKEMELNEKDDILKQLQNEIQELKLSINEIVCGSTETADSRTQELKMSIETLNTLLAKSMEEKQRYMDQLANHANCKNTIDNLNKEVFNLTEEIDKLNKAVKDSDENIFDISNTLDQYKEEVEFRNTENDKLKQNENQLQDNVKHLQLDNKDLKEEIEKSISEVMEVLEEYNNFRKEAEEKINQLSTANNNLKKALLEKDTNIESLKNQNKSIDEDLREVNLRREKDNLKNEKSLSEISALFRDKEEELLIVANELELKEADLQLLEEENNTLKEQLLFITEETAIIEKQFLKSVHQEENEKSDYNTNRYMEQLNEIKTLSINYDIAVKRNEELNNFLNKVSTELKELKLNLHKLLKDLENKLISLKENSRQSNGLDPNSSNNIKDIKEMGKCIRAFSKSLCYEDQELSESLKTDKSNHVVRANENDSKFNTTAKSIDANNLIVKRNYLIKRIESVDEQISNIRLKSTDMKIVKSDCDCNSFEDDIDSLTFKRQNYIEQINIIEQELLKYDINCDCDLNKTENYTAPNLHSGESLQIIQQLTISVCNMKEQLTTKIKDYIINKDQVTQSVNFEKVVQDQSVQCEVNDERNHTQQISTPKNDKQEPSAHMCPCNPKETKILYKYETPTNDDKGVNTERQQRVQIKSENYLAPKPKDDLEPKLPHTFVKDNSSTNYSRTDTKEEDKSLCNCGILLEDP